jgi:hypothetical protein
MPYWRLRIPVVMPRVEYSRIEIAIAVAWHTALADFHARDIGYEVLRTHRCCRPLRVIFKLSRSIAIDVSLSSDSDRLAATRKSAASGHKQTRHSSPSFSD